MGNKPKQASSYERRAKIEEMRRQQQAAEKRRNLIVIGLGALLGLGLIAAVAVPAVLKEREQSAPVDTIGVALAAAACDTPTDDPATSDRHIEQGTRITYATVPPSNGDHYGTPAPISRHFYTAEDRPPVEQLVHNLEHGYTILWYDATITGDALQAARDLSDRIPRDAQNRKFIVAAWDDSLGAFPEGKHIALAHWSADKRGHRQFCGAISGAAVAQFMQTFPASDSPEPRAA